jgi:hypothetical protein
MRRGVQTGFTSALDHPGRQTLLDLDPELGAMLREERAEAARRDVLVAVEPVARGGFAPAAYLTPAPANIGLLIVSGAAACQLSVHGHQSAELFGPGDLIRPDDEHEHRETLEWAMQWTALSPLTVAVLGPTAAVSLARYPQVMLALLARSEARARRLAIAKAIAQITGVDRRLHALLWHLAEHWGKVRADGVLLPLDLSHQLLGTLVGARRPTVSTALAALAQRQTITRHPDGWLLHRGPTTVADPSEDLMLELKPFVCLTPLTAVA